MNTKMTTNSQLLTTKPKTETKQTKQTTRTGTESQKCDSVMEGYPNGGLLVRKWRGEIGGKGTRNKKHNW